MEQLPTQAGTGTAAQPDSSTDSLDDLLGTDTASDSSEGDASYDDIFGAEEATDEPEATEGEDAQEQPEQTEQQPDRRQQLAEMAKKYGLDLNNPAHKQALRELMAATKRNQDKDAYIQKIRDEGLTEFERSLQERPKGQQEEKPQQQNLPADASQPVPQGIRFNDGFDDLKTYGDFYKRSLDAWDKVAKTGDYDEIFRVENAMFDRRMAERALPQVASMVQHLMEQRLQQFAEKDLGDVIPTVKESVAQRRAKEAHDYAVTELMKTPGFKQDYEALMKPDSEELLDGRYRNNAYNRILGEFPGIHQMQVREGDIITIGAQQVKVPDPWTAKVLTSQLQMRTIREIYRSQRKSGVTPEVAKQLKQDGAQQAERKLRERGRQQLNSGANNRSPVAANSDDDWITGLQGAETLGISAAKAFARRK